MSRGLLTDRQAPGCDHQGEGWCVLQTLPRCEKKLAGWLSRHSIEHYLPLRRRLHAYESKTVSFDSALFPGYVFASFGQAERTAVLRSNAVARTLAVPDQDALLRDLAQIRNAAEADAPLEPAQFVREGQRVRVSSGRWRGVEGTIVRFAGATRVALAVQFLQSAVSFEVDAGLLDPVN